MRFRIKDDVISRFPTFCVGIVVAHDVENAREVATISRLLREAERSLPQRIGAQPPRDAPALSLWHEAFRAAGINPGRFKTSVEALATRVLKGEPVPSLSPAVDLANALSLTYLLPIGAHDLAHLQGDLEVGPIVSPLPFTPLGGGDQEIVERGEYAYADAAEVRTRRWVWRQGDHSKVTERSRSIVFPIDGWIGATDAAVRDAQAGLARLLEAELGASTEVHFLDREHPEAVFQRGGDATDTVVRDRDGFRMAGLGARERPAASLPVPGEWPVVVASGAGRSAVPAIAERHEHKDEIDELLARGTVDVVVREVLEQRLRRGDRLRVKFGVDPTGPQLHLGHAVQLRKLRAFQRLGHTICLVVGDFTAQIGDASDKTAMRQMLTEEQIYANLATYRKQIARVLDPDKVEWSYNNDWLGPLRFKDVVGLAANFTVAQMLERENFRLRFEAGKPVGLQEFMYPLMQGYDSVALKADVEIGGTEQLFNLMAGRTLQQAFGQPPQVVMTCALLLGTDGQKMSKTAANCIFLDDVPKDMYGKVMSIADDQIVPYFELCTEVPLPELPGIEADLAAGTNPMLIKKRLAYEITRLYHGPKQAEKAAEAFEREVQRKELPDTIEVKEIDSDEPRSLPDLLLTLGLVKSKSEGRRLAADGAVRVDGEAVSDISTPIRPRDGMLVRAGKRKYVRVRLRS